MALVLVQVGCLLCGAHLKLWIPNLVITVVTCVVTWLLTTEMDKNPN